MRGRRMSRTSAWARPPATFAFFSATSPSPCFRVRVRRCSPSNSPPWTPPPRSPASRSNSLGPRRPTQSRRSIFSTARATPSPEAVSSGAAIVTLQTVGGDEPLGYVGVVPAVPLIDGAFAEWSGESADAIGEPGTGGNPSVDVAGIGAVVGAANLTFHVRLQGPAFAGIVITA